jgi:hypothetical protein
MKSSNKVVKRFGGRHLIFQACVSDKSWLPKPYALVSSFRGPYWFFYGIGQVFVTHRVLGEFEKWQARVPRSPKSAAKLEKMLMQLEPELNAFIKHCNEHGIEGTIVVEKDVLEFHWTFGHELEQEKLKDENRSPLEVKFDALVNEFSKERLRVFKT